MKEDLRPCIVKIGEETETIQSLISEPITQIIKEGQEHNGFFHMWYKEERTDESVETLLNNGVKTSLFGIVEYEDGSVHRVEPECINFTDRDCKD